MPETTTYNALLDALKERIVKSNSHHTMARCPLSGHTNDDKNPGLSVTNNGGNTLVYCHGQHGTCYNELLDHYSIEHDERNTPTSKKPELIDLYSYEDKVDDKWVTTYQVARFVPKTFRQRRPDGEGGWISNLDGVTRVPYHLRQLLEAIEEGRPILFVEGEKDVRNAEYFGFSATTTQGSSGWKKGEYAKWFKDADIIIIPDNDATGERYAFEVARDLYRVANEVRLMRLPVDSKGDLTDYLLEHKPSELVALMTDTDTFDPDRDRLNDALTLSNAIATECVVDSTIDGLTFTWAKDEVVIYITDIIAERSSIRARIDIDYSIHGRVVHRQRIDLESASQRDSLRTRLNQKEKDVNRERKWMDYIGFACGTAIDFYTSPKKWTDLASMPEPEPSELAWIVPPMWQGRAGQPSVMLLVAHGETGKSYLAESMALSIMTGHSTLGPHLPGITGKVLVLDYESNEDTWVERLYELARGAGIDLDEHKGKLLYTREVTPLPLTAKEMAKEIEREGIVAVIVDAAAGAARGNLNDNETINSLYGACEILGRPVVLIHHTNKEDIYFGSVYFYNRARLKWESVTSVITHDDEEYTEKIVVWEVDKTSNVRRSLFADGRIAFKYTWRHKAEGGKTLEITPIPSKLARFMSDMKDGEDNEINDRDRVQYLLVTNRGWWTLDAVMESIFPDGDTEQRRRLRNNMNGMVSKTGALKSRTNSDNEREYALPDEPDEDKW